MSIEREELERRANALRADLLDTVSVVDQRRHEAMNLGLQLKKRWLVLAVAGGSLTGAIAATIVLKRKVHRARLPELRKEAAQRMWEHPERVAQHDRPSWVRDFGYKLLMALASAAIITPVQIAVKRMVSKI